MFKIYFQNYTYKISVSAYNPLNASLEQTLDIFNTLPEDDGSYLGIIFNSDIFIEFSKFNKFIWIIQIAVSSENGSYLIFFSKNKCIKLIKNIFKGFNPLNLEGLIFEKNK